MEPNESVLPHPVNYFLLFAILYYLPFLSIISSAGPYLTRSGSTSLPRYSPAVVTSNMVITGSTPPRMSSRIPLPTKAQRASWVTMKPLPDCKKGTPTKSTSLALLLPESQPPLKHPHWISLPTEEPLTSGMEDEVRMALNEYYKFYRKDVNFRMNTKYCWMREQMILPLENSTARKLEAREVSRFCNKPTFLYWAHAAQIKDRCPGLIFGCIYKRWFRHHNNDPNIEFGHFFANPIRITSTGPKSVTGILEAHKSLCDDISLTLRKVGQSEPGYTSYPWPNPQYYKLLPICRAVIAVLDELGPEPDLDPDGFINLNTLSQKQSILIIRTGDESCLSAPISFESIATQSLPLARCDIIGKYDAVRVPLSTAVGFVADLMHREETAFPNLRDSSLVDSSLSPPTYDRDYKVYSAQAWVDKIMQEAEKKGIDNVSETADAVRRVKAAKRGEIFAKGGLSPYLFSGKWK